MGHSKPVSLPITKVNLMFRITKYAVSISALCFTFLTAKVVNRE